MKSNDRTRVIFISLLNRHKWFKLLLDNLRLCFLLKISWLWVARNIHWATTIKCKYKMKTIFSICICTWRRINVTPQQFDFQGSLCFPELKSVLCKCSSFYFCLFLSRCLNAWLSFWFCRFSNYCQFLLLFFPDCQISVSKGHPVKIYWLFRSGNALLSEINLI